MPLMLAFGGLSLTAQPINDNWANAIEIQLGDEYDMGVGVFQSDTVNLAGAGNETGEFLFNQAYVRTAWYKFTIPAHRSVLIRTLEPSEVMENDDAGFVVYSSTPAIPGEDDMAIFTPRLSLASYSENICLFPGEYYVQLIGRNSAQSEAFIELSVDYTYQVSHNESEDMLENAANMGTLSDQLNSSFTWNCTSMETQFEYDSLHAADSLEFNKTMWFTFTTDDHIDLLSFYFWGGWSLNGSPYSIRFYEDSITLANLGDKDPIYHERHGFANGWRHVPCHFKPNQEYTVLITGHQDYNGSFNFRLKHLGEGLITGAYPQETGFNPANEFGSIIPTPGNGVAMDLFDYFSCEALLMNDSIQCGTANPADSMYYDPFEYDLTTWFTFSSTTASNAIFRAWVRSTSACNSNYFNHDMRIRIYNRNTDNDCVNYNFPDDIYYDGKLNGNGLVILNCFPPGDYAIQLLGRSLINGNPYDCDDSQLGRRVNMRITMSSVPAVEYGLTTSGDVDWINGGTALQNGTQYFADSARFSCTKTVMPDTSICDTLYDRGIYRQLLIGDSDGDGSLDSGLVTVSNFRFWSSTLNQRSQSVFYRGDADSLATDQGAFSHPQEITGLEPLDGCNMWNTYGWWQWNNYYVYNTKRYCVTPGTYSLASVGDSTENNSVSAPNFTFQKQITSPYYDYNTPDSLGDIIAEGMSVTSSNEYFSCIDNPDTIGGLAPCNGYKKQIYREFYLSQAATISVNEISNTSAPYTRMRLYQGRISDVGPDGVTLAPYHSNGCYSGHSNNDYSVPGGDCNSIPPGWYTVVSYGWGPNYENNFDFNETHLFNQARSQRSNIQHTSRIVVSADTTISPGPFYNRPHKACVHPDTIKYINTGTVDNPSVSSGYTFCTERFMNTVDTPFAAIPLAGCPSSDRVAFYVFTTDDEYYARINGVNGYYKELYPLDVTTADSLLFPDTIPLVSCSNQLTKLEICRLQPGTYTLVVFNNSCNQTITPSISVSPVGISRFDFAINAYDFGLVPEDDTFIGGKPGDVHPDNPILLPSSDWFYCTTGAFSSDPSPSCTGSAVYDPIYPDSINNVYYEQGENGNFRNRRNLWYTFVTEGMGTWTTTVRNLNSGGNFPYAVYRSDVDGNLDFSEVIANGELDSLNTDLSFVQDNIGSSCSRSQSTSYTFHPSNCVDDTLKRRYYLVVDISEYYVGEPNRQVDVQVKWNPIDINPIEPNYDYYYQANVIGDWEDEPPYTNSPLEFDSLYSGAWDNISCATSDTTDESLNPLWNCNANNKKTLWWKLTVEEPGFLYLGLESDLTNPNSFYRGFIQQMPGNDSIISPGGVNGLLNLGQGSSGGPGGGVPNYSWRWRCIQPGVYYYHITRCSATDSSDVRPHAYFRPIQGDRCTEAVATSGDTFGTYSVSVPIRCHTIGTDFGEDGSDMSCLQGPDGFNSTWFKFNYTGTDLVDILFQLNLSSLSNYSSSSNLRYRLFYGDSCSTMIEGTDCSNNAFINNSIACISGDEGAFYVQVTYPTSSTGTLGFNFTVSENTDPDCNPFVPSLITADFGAQMNCTSDSLHFLNYSTSGASLEYVWEMGDGNTVTETNFTYAYDNGGDYDVTLFVINPILQDTVSVTYTVSFEQGYTPLELGVDRTICEGDTVMFGYFVSQALYNWSTNEQTNQIVAADSGQYWLEMTLNGCTYTDTVNLNVIDLGFDLGDTLQKCIYESTVLSYDETEYGASFEWSTGATIDSIIAPTEGDYWLELTHLNCVVRDSVFVKDLDLSFDLGNDTTICLGESITLQPDVQPGVAYDWNTGITASALQTDTAGLYQLEITKDGCFAEDSITIDILDLGLDLGPDTIICQGDLFTINPIVNSEVSYLWIDGSTASTFTTGVEGMYSLTVDTVNCFAQDSVYVNVLDLGFDLGSDTLICFGDTLDILPNVMPNVGFSWNTGSILGQIQADTTGLYELTIDSLHCEASSDIYLEVLDLRLDLGNDTTICDGSSLTLSPGSFTGVDYLWTGGSSGSALTVDTTNTYNLTISDQGCDESDSIAVDIFFVDPIFNSPIVTCLNDTVVSIITGVDSVMWDSNPNLSVVDQTSAEFFPPDDASFSFTAFENGCIQDAVLEVDIIQPYIPAPVYDDEYCLNEGMIEFPTIDFTTGTFTYEGTPVTELITQDIGTGFHTVLYQYADTNSCIWEIDLTFNVIDTTTTSFNIDELYCADEIGIDLNQFTSNTPALFTFSYDGTEVDTSDTFDVQLIPGFIDAPQEFIVNYEFTDQNACVSTLFDTLRVHPLPIVDFEINDMCRFDTLNITNSSSVNGSSISSYYWTFEDNMVSTDTVPDDINYDVPGIFNAELELTSTIGCVASYDTTFTVHDLPVLTTDAYGPFCLNDGVFLTPDGNEPDGSYFFQDQEVIADLNTFDLGLGDFEIFYNYTDSNSCFNEIVIPFTINDTTLTSFIDEIPPYCSDLGAIELNDIVSDNPGLFYFSYGNSITDTSSVFNTDSIAIDVLTPQSFEINYEFTNSDQCTSHITGEIVVHPLPVVDYSVDDICLFDTLSIVNSSSVEGSSIQSYLWSFEGQGEFTDDIPEDLSYNSPGEYSVSLEVTSSVGCLAIEDSTFTVHDLPFLSVEPFGPFCLNDGDIALPEINIDEGILEYDGLEISGLNTYDIGSGEHEILYHFTDSNSCYNELDIPFLVNDTTTIEFTEAFPEICIDSESLPLNDYINIQGGTFAYSLNEVDTIISDFFAPDLISGDFNEPETYNVFYQYINAESCTSNINNALTVHPLPISSFEIPNTCIFSELQVTNTSSVEGSIIEAYDWNFETQGTFSDEVPQGVSYDTSGTFEITLSVTSSIGCETDSVAEIVIFPLPVLTAEEFGSYCINDGIQPLPTVSPLGGQFSSLGFTINDFNTYDYLIGENIIVYTYQDNNNCVNQINIPFEIRDTTTISFVEPYPAICIDASPFNLLDNLSHQPATLSLEYEPGLWTESDNLVPGDIPNFSTDPYEVPIQYIFTNDEDCTSEIFSSQVVHPLPVIDIEVPDICHNLPQEIVNNSFASGSSISSWYWNIDEMGEFDVPEPLPYWFSEPASYSYTFNLESSIGCFNSQSGIFDVHPVPESVFSKEGQCNNEEVEFTAYSQIEGGVIQTYLWWMDGESYESDENFSFMFPDWGMHEVGLSTVSDFGCLDTVIQNHFIYPAPEGEIILEDHCYEIETFIEGMASVDTGSVTTVQWSSSNEFAVVDSYNFAHTFSTPEIHPVVLYLESNRGCVTALTENVEVYPLPIPDFQLGDTAICARTSTSFEDLSSVTPPQTIDMVMWSFSNGEYFTESSGEILALSPGIIDLNQTVISDFGCTETVDHPNVLTVWPSPRASFNTDPSNPKISDPRIQIIDQSQGEIVSWYYEVAPDSWYWKSNPEHTFSEVGDYPIFLEVENNFGCVDSTLRVITVDGFIIYVPNSFTPNGDGINDIFKPTLAGVEPSVYEFIVFDRWGKEVFKSSDPETGWNGQSMNDEYFGQTAVYQYYLKVKGKGTDLEEFSGHITLVR